MTERLAPRGPHPGLADSIAAWLFPSLYPRSLGPGITESEFARRQAAAEARGEVELICTRIIPDPEPEA